MPRFLNPKFLLALAFGAGLVAVVAAFSKDDDFDSEHQYGEPDGHVTDADVASFVD